MTTSLPKISNSPEYEYFSRYYNNDQSISGDKYDAVVTFILSKTDGNRDAAFSLADGIFKLAYNQGIDPMRILDQYKKIDSDENLKTALLAMLNSSRNNTSKLGYAKQPVQNQYVVRNIRV